MASASVKVVLSETDTRRLALPATDRFNFLLSFVTKHFVPQKGFEHSAPPFYVKYLDDEQELVTISSEDELNEAIEISGGTALKLQVFPNTSPPNIDGVEFNVMDSVILVHNNSSPADAESKSAEAAVPVPLKKVAVTEAPRAAPAPFEEEPDSDIVEVSERASPSLESVRSEEPVSAPSPAAPVESAAPAVEAVTTQLNELVVESPSAPAPVPVSTVVAAAPVTVAEEKRPEAPAAAPAPSVPLIPLTASTVLPTPDSEQKNEGETKVEKKKKAKRIIRPTVGDVIQSLATDKSFIHSLSHSVPLVALGPMREEKEVSDLSKSFAIFVAEVIEKALPFVNDPEQKFALDVIKQELGSNGTSGAFQRTEAAFRKDVHSLVKDKLKEHRKAKKAAAKQAKQEEKLKAKELKQELKQAAKTAKSQTSPAITRIFSASAVSPAPILAPAPVPAPIAAAPVALPIVATAAPVSAPAPSPVVAPVVIAPVAAPVAAEAVEGKAVEVAVQAPVAAAPQSSESESVMLARMLTAIPELLRKSDLAHTTMRMVRQQLSLSFPAEFVEAHKQEIKDVVTSSIQDIQEQQRKQQAQIHPQPQPHPHAQVLAQAPLPPQPAVAPAPAKPMPAAFAAFLPANNASPPPPTNPFFDKPAAPQMPPGLTPDETSKMQELLNMGFNNVEVNVYCIREFKTMDRILDWLLQQQRK